MSASTPMITVATVKRKLGIPIKAVDGIPSGVVPLYVGNFKVKKAQTEASNNQIDCIRCNM